MLKKLTSFTINEEEMREAISDYIAKKYGIIGIGVELKNHPSVNPTTYTVSFGEDISPIEK